MKLMAAEGDDVGDGADAEIGPELAGTPPFTAEELEDVTGLLDVPSFVRVEECDELCDGAAASELLCAVTSPLIPRPPQAVSVANKKSIAISHTRTVRAL